jgi:hypothetical protein
MKIIVEYLSVVKPSGRDFVHLITSTSPVSREFLTRIPLRCPTWAFPTFPRNPLEQTSWLRALKGLKETGEEAKIKNPSKFRWAFLQRTYG